MFLSMVAGNSIMHVKRSWPIDWPHRCMIKQMKRTCQPSADAQEHD